MDELVKIYNAMEKADKRWNAEVVDDPEEMWEEYPEFLRWAVPALKKYIVEHSQ